LSRLADLAFERLHLVGNIGRDTRPPAAIDLGLFNPPMTRLPHAA
jgi:hypothetical protein